jgi:hypothetical protein
MTTTRRRTLFIVVAVCLGIVGVVFVALFAVQQVSYDSGRIALPRPAPAPADRTSVKSVDAVVRALDWGNVSFNAPHNMTFGVAQLVELALSPSSSRAELQAQLQDRVDVESAHIQISNRMEAQLAGQGFSIEAVTPIQQAVSSDHTTRWAWQVTPTQPGRRELFLAVSAHIDIGDHDETYVVQTYKQVIDVEIKLPQRVYGFIQANWQWLWAAIFVPIAGYLLRWWNRRPNRGGGSRTAP